MAQIFIERGLLAKGEAGRWLALQQGYEYVNLTAEPIDVHIAQLLPEPFARRLMALPIRQEGKDLIVAMADPSDILALDEITRATGLRVQPVFTSETDLAWALAQLFDDVRGKVNKAVSPVRAIACGEGHANGDGVDGASLILRNEVS